MGRRNQSFTLAASFMAQRTASTSLVLRITSAIAVRCQGIRAANRRLSRISASVAAPAKSVNLSQAVPGFRVRAQSMSAAHQRAQVTARSGSWLNAAIRGSSGTSFGISGGAPAVSQSRSTRNHELDAGTA